jgi:hypothetical protein
MRIPRRPWRIRIEGDRVLVDRDAGPIEGRLGGLARDAAREDVEEHEVVVGAARHEPPALAREGRREGLGVGDDLLLIRP